MVQFTGAGTTSDGYYRITSVPAKNQIAIAKTSGDPVITTSQYAFVVGPSVSVSSAPYNSTTGITTFTLSAHHGLVGGNRFRAIDSSNNNLGDFIISERIGINTFTTITNRSVSSAAYILKHGLSANEGTSDSSAENLGIRGIPLFAEETLTAVSFASTTQIRVSSPAGGVAITKRFPLGSYIQIDDEIMRVASSTLSGTFSDEITVIRGALGTKQSTHDDGSLIKKIDPISVEFRRPSIVRASGHTFEYLGYGPGNYSTGLPQVQVTSLTEREEFLVQSQERSGGVVVYNGINNNGDVFNGNTKTSASSGEITSYDIPKPTVTGEDPSRLSVVFDEVTVKERLVVEGGNSNTVLSQFNGPVTFNKEVKLNDAVNVKSQLKVSSTADSTTTATGALVVSGGVGIAKTLNVGGNTNVTGTLNITGATTLSNTLNVTGTSTFTDKIIPSSGTGSKGIVWASDPGGGTGDTAFIQYYVQSGENTRLHIGIQNDAEDDLYLEATQTTTSGALTVSNALDVTGTTTLNNSVTLVGSDTAATEYFKIKNGSSTDKFTVDSSSGNTIISGTLNVTGVTTVSNAFNVIGNTTITNGDLYITRTDGAGGDILANGGTDGIFAIYNTTNSGTIWLNAKNSGGTYNNILSLTSTIATVSGDLNVTGDITAFYTSDQRLKENIVPIVNPLAKVLSISGNTYDWVQGSGKEGSDVGVIAQELLDVLPEAVTTRETGYLAVRYEKIIPLLIEAIKDLSAKVEDLQQKLNDK